MERESQSPSFSTPRHQLFPEFVRQLQSTILIRRTARMENRRSVGVGPAPSSVVHCGSARAPASRARAASSPPPQPSSRRPLPAIAAEKATLPLVAMVFTSLKAEASKAFLRSSIVTAWPPTLMPRRNATSSAIWEQRSTRACYHFPQNPSNYEVEANV